MDCLIFILLINKNYISIDDFISYSFLKGKGVSTVRTITLNFVHLEILRYNVVRPEC